MLVFLFGLVFLLGSMGVLSGMTVAYTWPVLIMIFGATRFMGGSCKCYMKS